MESVPSTPGVCCWALALKESVPTEIRELNKIRLLRPSEGRILDDVFDGNVTVFVALWPPAELAPNRIVYPHATNQLQIGSLFAFIEKEDRAAMPFPHGPVHAVNEPFECLKFLISRAKCVKDTRLWEPRHKANRVTEYAATSPFRYHTGADPPSTGDKIDRVEFPVYEDSIGIA
jgi:hypothetical protein